MGNFTQHFTFSHLKALAFVSVAALTMVAPTAHGRTITAEEALQRVMEQPQSKTLDFKATPRLVYTMPLTESQTPGLYVFNNADNRGYVIVSADDEANALLGYSVTGTFDPQNIPAPLAYWLECYTEEIASLQQSGPTQSFARTYGANSSVEPMMTTRWTQTPPFNNQCPQIDERATVTGCTATAMAQVMKYFNHPATGTGYNEYEWGEGIISSNFEDHTYDWDNMLDSYSGEYDLAQEEAVSQLMRDCAVAINTNFGVDNSSASLIDALVVLNNNFNYDPQAKYMARKYYTLSEWEEAIYDQLDNHGPVIYAGTDSSNKGHTFVIDGYSYNYFHINWGWAGMSDNYYLLSALNPPQPGVGGGTSGYNNRQYIITNLFPSQGGETWIELVSDFSLTINEASANLGKTINFSIGLSNLSAVDVTPCVGLAFTNTSDNQTTFSTGSKISQSFSPASQSKTPISFSQNIPTDLMDGTYIVRPAYKDLAGEWHIMHVSMSQTRSYNMTVSDKTATFIADEAPVPTVVASELLSSLYAYSVFKATVTIQNNTDQEFYGIVYPCFKQNGSIRGISPGLQVSLEPQEERQFEYIGKCNVQAGRYKMDYVIQSPNDTTSYISISDMIDVTINQAAPVLPKVINLKFADDNTEDVNASELTITFDVDIDGGIYQNPIYTSLYSAKGGSSLTTFISEPMFFDSGLTKDVTLTTDISAWVEIGNTYQIHLFALYGVSLYSISDTYRFTIGSLDGINSVAADTEEVCSSTYYNMQGQRLSGTPAQGGLYIRVDTLSNGAMRSSKVMLK